MGYDERIDQTGTVMKKLDDAEKHLSEIEIFPKKSPALKSKARSAVKEAFKAVADFQRGIVNGEV